MGSGGELRGGTKSLHAHVAVSTPVGSRASMGVVFLDADGRVLRRTGRVLPDTPTRDLAAFRGIIYALWNSRRFGARWVVVHSDNPGVVAQINGDQEVDPALVGPYLEVRALLHAYRSVSVTVDQTRGDREALEVAQAARAGDMEETIEDLPLWAGQSMGERSTA